MTKKLFLLLFTGLAIIGPARWHGITAASPADAPVFANPVLPGFHPDPSVCRVGDDYYLVTSSFEWFPGLPVFHSKDLVNWKQIGYVLDRPSQLQMKEGMPHSSGLWAPTIRYHQGKYYVICTATGAGGNFFVTADRPEGPYSEPVFINDAPGIDPSLFFDDDGKCWYCGSWNGSNKTPPRRWFAEDRIYIQELDLATGQFKGERKIVSSGYAINSPYAEAPHIYKINGKYYLLIAEGGTWEDHAVTIFTADSVQGPYTPFITNPLLTHRHLGKNIDITTVGHADMVQTQFGDWYAVMLGVRPVEGYNMLGRETFLTSVEFQGDVPIFNPGVGRVLMTDKRPRLPWTPVPPLPVRDNFDGNELGLCWNFLRTPFTKWYTLGNGNLILILRPERVQDLVNPSLIARRVEHHRFEAGCKMTFGSLTGNDEAGMIIMQNNKFHYRLVVQLRDRKKYVRLLKVEGGEEACIAEKEMGGKEVCLKITGDMLTYSFYAGESETDMTALGMGQDATICSTNKARGFIGPYVGMYASSNGTQIRTTRTVSYDWFDYRGISTQ